jgi:hypothetical protein
MYSALYSAQLLLLMRKFNAVDREINTALTATARRTCMTYKSKQFSTPSSSAQCQLCKAALADLVAWCRAAVWAINSCIIGKFFHHLDDTCRHMGHTLPQVDGTNLSFYNSTTQ